MRFSDLVILGQFPPPVTGEAAVNQHIFNLFSKKKAVKFVNTGLISNASDVGVFSLIKIFKLFAVLFNSFISVLNCKVVYLTPGQSFLGLLRFYPIVIFSSLLGRRIVSHWHGYGIYYLALKHRFLTGFFLRICSENIFLTHDLRGKIRDLGFFVDNICVLNNYTEYISPLHPRSCDSRLKVLFMGSLMIEKGIMQFIAAAEICSTIDFAVCGGGAKEIEEICISKALELPNFYYHGVVSGGEKLNIISSSDVFVLQTNYKTEGVPLSILDAMALGLAIVTTSHNGIPEAVDDAAVWVNLSVEDLCQKIKDLASRRDFLHDMKCRSLRRSEFFSVASFNLSFSNLIFNENTFDWD